VKQMHKLVDVLRLTELAPGESVERELALIKVAAPPSRRPELLALADAFRARVADLGPNALVFEVTGPPADIDSFEELVRPHGVKELVRTGLVGLSRASSPAPTQRRQQVPS
jgi:acetolactate synthase-1/3 small subunit